jgi:signal transduction histidine kinase
MSPPLSALDINDERDVARARQHARTIAERLGFGPREQSRLASVVSGFASGVARHPGGGRLEFGLEGEPARSLAIRVVAHSPGDPHRGEDHLLDAARRVMDAFLADASTGPGTSIAMTKALPRQVAAEDVEKLVEELLGLDPASTGEEARSQDRELLKALEHLEARERELAQVSRELEDTNRGVMALYVELDDRADSLRRASEMKTRFLASVSHELRTPLSSILSLARLLLDRADGELSVEQDRQVTFILRSAHDLTGMVNDLLDMARIEAGREVVRPSEVDLRELFGALRGMLRPLVPAGSAVDLAFEDPAGLPRMTTDEGKLAQVLRNFLSNALKFTERGEVRLRAEPGPRETITFSVVDTGIGIKPEHIPRIFEEFGQVDGPLQRRAKGTGLGLPLARKLAKLLGGEIDVKSEPGVGSTFSATIPIHHPGLAQEGGPVDG